VSDIEEISDGDVGPLSAALPAQVSITVYDANTGAILYSTDVTEGREADCCGPGEVWRHGHLDGGSQRIDLATGEPAPLLTMALTVEPHRVAGIPPGTTALWKRDKAVIDDGELEFETDGLPEVIRVRLLNPIYVPVMVDVPCE